MDKNAEMQADLLNLADMFDKNGLVAEADVVDTILDKTAGRVWDRHKEEVAEVGTAGVVALVISLFTLVIGMAPVVTAVLSLTGVIMAGSALFGGVVYWIADKIDEFIQACERVLAIASGSGGGGPVPGGGGGGGPVPTPSGGGGSGGGGSGGSGGSGGGGGSPPPRGGTKADWLAEIRRLNKRMKSIQTKYTSNLTKLQRLRTSGGDPAIITDLESETVRQRNQINRFRQDRDYARDRRRRARASDVMNVVNRLERHGMTKEAEELRYIVQEAFLGKVWEKVKGGAGAVKEKLSDMKTSLTKGLGMAKEVLSKLGKADKKDKAALASKLPKDKVSAVKKVLDQLRKLSAALKKGKKD